MRSWPYSDALRLLCADRLAGFSARHRGDPGELKRAAVAIALAPAEDSASVDRPSEAAFLLTVRAATLRAHRGQLALPGGRVDADETVAAAALRELDEELGIAAQPPAILGALDDYETRSGYLITPLVIWLPAPSILRPNPAEVARVYRVPLSELQRPDSPEIFAIAESDRPVIRLPLAPLSGHVNAPTAAVLYQFREVVLEGRPTRVDHFDQPSWAWR